MAGALGEVDGLGLAVGEGASLGASDGVGFGDVEGSRLGVSDEPSVGSADGEGSTPGVVGSGVGFKASADGNDGSGSE